MALSIDLTKGQSLSITSMQTKMFLQCPLLCKSAVTMDAREWTFPFVPAYVALPCILMQEAFCAKFAFPWPFASVAFHVQLKLRGRGEFSPAEIARIRFLTGVNAHVFLQITILRKTLLTHFASIWLVTCVPSKKDNISFLRYWIVISRIQLHCKVFI